MINIHNLDNLLHHYAADNEVAIGDDKREQSKNQNSNIADYSLKYNLVLLNYHLLSFLHRHHYLTRSQLKMWLR